MIDIDLVLIDCDTFRPENFDILSHIHSIRKTTHCLVVEKSKHELDEQDLLCQISVQVMIQEIYNYRLFVKSFYQNFWNKNLSEDENYDFFEDEDDKISNEEMEEIDKKLDEIDEFSMETDLGNGITLNDLVKINEDGSVECKDTSNLDIPPSYTLGHPDKVKKYNCKELEPISRKLMLYFIENLKKELSIQDICVYMWKEYNQTRRNSLYVYIRRLRKFLDDDTTTPSKLVKTAKGCYKLDVEKSIFTSVQTDSK